MNLKLISPEELEKSLSIRDLSDPAQGRHAMQLLLDDVVTRLSHKWQCATMIYRTCPVVTVSENYNDLGYPLEGAARDARYTRYISPSVILRTQITSAIPNLLRALRSHMATNVMSDLLVACPGLAYRRDVIDRIHVGEPHQLDLWRLKRGVLASKDLEEMIALVVATLLPGKKWRTVRAKHPYTVDGLQIDVASGEEWIEIGECGLASPDLLKRCGHDPSVVSGLAMGVGLDRLLMLRKGIDDIRLLRSTDERVASQMQTLDPYKNVSNQPPAKRDLSICVEEEVDAEQLGDRVRAALGTSVDSLECLEIVSETPYEVLPESARLRMGAQPGQKNILIRLVIRHPTKTLTSDEANDIRDQVYLRVHTGSALELAKR